jgi:hypothetical protein
MAARLRHGPLHHAVVAALALTIVLGSAFVWIGVPLAGLWVAGELTTESDRFLLLALCSIPTAMVLFGWLIYRVNRVYVGLRGGPGAASPRSAWLRSSSDARRPGRGAGGPRPLIDVAMAASAWAAVVLMAIWFFFYAELTLVSW